MKSHRKKQIKLLYILFHRVACRIFLSINLAHLTTKYFAYDTSVDHGFYTPITLTPPNLSLCFDLNTILGGHEILMFNNHTPEFLGKTSKQIFDGTPAANSVLKGCVIRDRVSDKIIQVNNSTQCNQLFTIEKYRMHCFICYLFRINKRHNFSINALAFSLNEPKLLYNLGIKGPLTKGHSVAPLLHLDELADYDRMYMKELFPSKKEKELYHLEYDLYEIRRLPHPYNTRCASEPRLRCLYTCFSREYAKDGLTRSNAVVRETEENSALKVIEYSNNEKQLKYRTSVTRRCKKGCKPEACNQKLVVTHFFGPFDSSKHKLSFNVGSYRSPINLMKYSPKLSLADYVTQLFSVSGIWVGFSVVSFIFTRERFNIIKAYKTLLVLKIMLYSQNLVSRTQVQVTPSLTGQRSEMNSRKFCPDSLFIFVAFKFITLLVFTGQALNLCFIYFKYETILTYHHSFNPVFTYRLPSTAVCLDLNDLYSSREQTSVSEKNYEDVLSRKNSWTNLTLDIIFNQTMDEDILMKCRVKSYDPTDYFKGTFQLKSKQECLREEFTFHKYYSRWQMCYLFNPKKLPQKLWQNNLVYGEINPAKLYSLILNPKIKHYRKIDLIMYFDKENASYISSDFRAISPSLAERRVVILTLHTIVFDYLPAPYETRCNPLYPRYKCLNQCRATKLLQLNRLPYSNIVKEQPKMQLLSFEDLKNPSVNEFYWRAENQCHEKCKTFVCSGNYSLTYARHAIGRTDSFVEVVVSPEAIPRTNSRSIPCFELYEFLYQIFCLLSFWLGFSFAGLNFILRKNEKRFNETAQFIYRESTKLLLSLRSLGGKINLNKANDLKRNLLIKKVIRYSVCALGMCLHLFLPTNEYLAYPTRLLTTIYDEQPVALKLFICSEAQDLFEKGILFGQSRKRGDKHIFDRNLDEIMREAKKLNRLMSCGYWGLSEEKKEANEMKKFTDRIFFESNDSSLCYKSFHSRMFLKQGHICFEYILRRKSIWNRSQMLASFNEAKTALRVSVNSSAISQRFNVIAFVDAPKTKPFHSSVWAPTVYKKFMQDYRFVVSYLTYSLQILPHPYSDKGFVPAHTTHCFFRCTNGKMNRFNLTRIAFGHQLLQSKLLSNAQRNNSLVDNLTNEIDRQCDTECSRRIFLKKTSYFYTVTMISEPIPNERGNGSTLFELRRTDDPVVSMKFFPAIPIYDLIINIGSVISIWFGLSVINIPDLASGDDMEKLYIRTVDNLKQTNCILKRVASSRVSIRAQ